MKSAIIGAGLAVALGGTAHGAEEVPTFRWCVDQVMGSLRTVIAPADEARAITMNMPDGALPQPPAAEPEPAPLPPPPVPAREPPLDELLAQACPVLRIEAGDVALAQYCDLAAPTDRWTCAVLADGDTLVTFAP